MLWSTIVAIWAGAPVINVPIRNFAHVLTTHGSESKSSQYENVADGDMIVEMKLGALKKTLFSIDLLHHENTLMDASVGCDMNMDFVTIGHRTLRGNNMEQLAYDPRLLSTFQVDNNDFEQLYERSYAGREQMTLGSGESIGARFHMVSTCGFGNSLGFAMSPLENEEEDKEVNFVQHCKQQGLIRSAVASFLFPRNQKDEGSLILGGLDHSRYKGTLGKMQMLNSIHGKGFSRSGAIEVVLGGIFVQGEAIVTVHYGVELTTLSWTSLPDVHLTAIANAFGGEFNHEMGEFIFTSDILSRQETLMFSFGGVPISVPIKELAYKCAEKTYCLSLGRKADNQVSSIGVDVLKHAYLVIDYENGEVALAQAAHSNWKLSSFEEASAGIPSATEAPGYSARIVDFYGHNASSSTEIHRESLGVLNKRATSGVTAKTTDAGGTPGTNGGTNTGTAKTTSMHGNTPVDTTTSSLVTTLRSSSRTSSRTSSTTRLASSSNNTTSSSTSGGLSPMLINVGETYCGVSLSYLYMGVIAAGFLVYA